MKAVAFSIKISEKEFLAKANNKKHDITLISNVLNAETVIYARGKMAVIVSLTDDVSDKMIHILSGLGVKYITTRSQGTDHIDKAAAARYGIALANVRLHLSHNITENAPGLYQAFKTNETLQTIANQTINNLDLWQHGKEFEKTSSPVKKNSHK
ncbi:MAG: hypothetical protein NVSMB24_00310 [Mucilaginibacter sp.]